MKDDYDFSDYEPPEVLVKYVPMGIFTEDKEGRPAYIFIIGNLDLYGLFSCVSSTQVLKYFIYKCEQAFTIMKENSIKHGKEINNIVLLFDMDRISLMELSTKIVLDTFSRMLKVLRKKYPKLLFKAYAIKTTTIFSIFYSMIKPFLGEKIRNKVVILGKDDWQESLLEDFHPDKLPKYFGGTLVHPVDGNIYGEMCLGGKIPEKYYSCNQKQLRWKGAKNIIIQRGCKATIDFKINKNNSVIHWSFQTESHDIRFGIFVTTTEKPKKYLVAKNRYECVSAEQGSLVCQEKGIYTLVFDNNYSWYNSKKVFYDVQVQTPDSDNVL